VKLNRSTNIASAIELQLTLGGVIAGTIGRETIYDFMQKAQDDIIGRVAPSEKRVSVYLANGVDKYSINDRLDREVFWAIKTPIVPTTWTESFEYVDSLLWPEVLGYGLTGQPQYYMVENSLIYIYPTPSGSYSGAKVEFPIMLNGANSTINETTEPEISLTFDEAIRFYVLSELHPTRGPEYFQKYLQQLEVKSDNKKTTVPGHIEGTW
jgi:hypothetical protein